MKMLLMYFHTTPSQPITNFSTNKYASHTANTMLTTTVSVSSAVFPVALMKDSCLQEYHPVINKWHFGRACCPYRPGPSRPRRLRQTSFSIMSKSIYPSTCHYIPRDMNLQYKVLAVKWVCVCVCADRSKPYFLSPALSSYIMAILTGWKVIQQPARANWPRCHGAKLSFRTWMEMWPSSTLVIYYTVGTPETRYLATHALVVQHGTL